MTDNLPPVADKPEISTATCLLTSLTGLLMVTALGMLLVGSVIFLLQLLGNQSIGISGGTLILASFVPFVLGNITGRLAGIPMGAKPGQAGRRKGLRTGSRDAGRDTAQDGSDNPT